MSDPTEPLDPAPYESRAYIPTTVVSVVLSLATITVGLRCYARAVLISQFGIDDWAILVALVLAMGSGIMVASSGFTSLECLCHETPLTSCLADALYGAGRHLAVVDPTLLWKYFRVCHISTSNRRSTY